MKKIIVLLSIVSLTAYSQVTGYLGKRFTVGYSVTTFPALGAMPSSDEGELELKWKAIHCGNIEYIVGKRSALIVGMQYSKYATRLNGIYVNGYNSTTLNYDPVPYSPAIISSTGLNLSYKFFGKRFLAPVGKYMKIDFLYLHNKVTLPEKAFSYTDYSGSNAIKKNMNYGSKEYIFNAIVLAATFGKQRIFFDVLAVDYGIRIGFTPQALASIDLFESNNSVSLENKIKTKNMERTFAYQVFNVHIGIGFLAF
jgi:hypothetical protein